jgi:hypothetical protein
MVKQLAENGVKAFRISLLVNQEFVIKADQRDVGAVVIVQRFAERREPIAIGLARYPFNRWSARSS